MAKDVSADLMQALVAKLYATVTGGQDIQLPRNKFVSWMLPGLAFEPRDFDFCSRGLIGDSAEETRARYQQAWAVSKLFDFVPDVSNQFVDDAMQQTIFASTQDTISSVYNDVLKYSQVVDLPLSDAEKAKLERFRKALTVTKEVEDIITGEMKEVTEPGPLTIAYTAKMNDYLDAADEYINMLIDAQAAKGNDPEAIRRVATFANKASFLRRRLDAAWGAWISQGYKNEKEQIDAYIEQVTQRSMVLYKDQLMRNFRNAILTSPEVGNAGDFYYTTLIPGSFANATGWTRFTFYEQDYETHYSKSTSSWSAGGSANFGLFSFGANASGSRTRIDESARSANFRASFEFTQVPIIRPWFDPGFFSMRGWKLDQMWDLNFNKQVSDGGEGRADNKPVGRLVAYPTTALFVRNVVFKQDNWDSQLNFIQSQVSAGGRVGYGPFSVGGSYSRGSEKRDTKFHAEGGELRIDGLQLIGCVNNIIPKCPNTNPNIPAEQFVGGVQLEPA